MKSAEQIYQLFGSLPAAGDDFVGTDMARKFIQMGYTRAVRYANYVKVFKDAARKYTG